MPTWEEARPLRTAFLVPEPVDGPPPAWAARIAARGDVVVEGPFDLAVACGPGAAPRLAGTAAARRVLFLEDMPERTLDPGDPRVATIVDAYTLPVAVIVVAEWIAEQLRVLRGDGAPPVHVVAPGVDKALLIAAPLADDHAPLRIAIPGDDPEAHAAAAAMREPSRLVDVAEADVVLTLPRVAGFPRAALEGFHCGATCVTTPVTGSDAYVRDGVNGLLTSWDDERGTSRLLDLLARDRALLARLRAGALATARAWPSQEDADAALVSALQDVAA